MICELCNKELKNIYAYRAHRWRVHTDAGLKFSETTCGRQPKPNHRKGLTKETSEEIRKTSEKVSLAFKRKVADGTYKPPIMGDGARKRLSVEQSLRNRGGRSKWFEYKGVKLQGTWEYNIAIKLDEMQVEWYKPTVNRDVWPYIIDGKQKSYTPDFYLPQFDLYLEVKGYWWGEDKKKMKAVKKAHSDRKIVFIEKAEYKRLMLGEQVW